MDLQGSPIFNFPLDHEIQDTGQLVSETAQINQRFPRVTSL